MLFAQAVGDYGSTASGNWTAPATWVVCKTAGQWTDATVATVIPTNSTNVVIRNGNTVVFDTSSKNCYNLTIESGAKLWCNSANTSPKYINFYGSQLVNNGTLGGSADAISIKPYGTAFTLTGSGSNGICRFQPQTASTTITFDADALVTYAGGSGTGSSCIYNNGQDNLTIVVNAGKTLTTAANAFITLGSSGSAAPSPGYSIALNINGTLTTGTGGSINFLNASSKTSSISIGSNGTLNANANILLPASASTGTLSIANGGVLNIASAYTLNVGATSTVTNGGTLTNSGIIKTSTTFTNNGTATMNGTFQLEEGGWATGSDFTYGAAGTLVFNNSSAMYTVSGTPVYWPGTNGPVNVTVQNTGGLELEVPRTVTGIFQTSGKVNNSYGNDLTVSGKVRINAGGYFNNFSPTYSGSAAELEYNTGGSYTNNLEWTGGSSVGYGVPQNVTFSNSTALTIAGDRSVPGVLSLANGNKLTLSDYNLTIGNGGSILSSASSYIVSSGAGSLVQTVPSATEVLFPIGSASAYTPVKVNPALSGNFAVKMTTSPGSAPSNVTFNAETWEITPSVPSSTVLTLTTASPASTVSNSIYHWNGSSYDDIPATLTGNNYSATVSSFSPFTTGGSTVATGINTPEAGSVKVYAASGKLYIVGAEAGTPVQIFTTSGSAYKTFVAGGDNEIVSVPQGLYLVKVGKDSAKILVK
jgi:hypothetical protein